MSEHMDVDTDVIPAAGEDHQPGTSQPIVTKPTNTGSVLATAATASVTVSLHPLVIMNISEHWTRIRAQEGSKQQGKPRSHKFASIVEKQNPIFVKTVIGALIGKQNGRNIEVMNSFELKFEVQFDMVLINSDYYKTKEEQCKCYSRD